MSLETPDASDGPRTPLLSGPSALRWALRGAFLTMIGGSMIGGCEFRDGGAKVEQVKPADMGVRFDQLHNRTDLIGCKVLVAIRLPDGKQEMVTATLVKQEVSGLMLAINDRRYRELAFAHLVTQAQYDPATDEIYMASDMMGSITFSRATYENIIRELWNAKGRQCNVSAFGTYRGMGMESDGVQALTFLRQ